VALKKAAMAGASKDIGTIGEDFTAWGEGDLPSLGGREGRGKWEGETKGEGKEVRKTETLPAEH